jgi:hypothetical protein
MRSQLKWQLIPGGILIDEAALGYGDSDGLVGIVASPFANCEGPGELICGQSRTKIGATRHSPDCMRADFGADDWATCRMR